MICATMHAEHRDELPKDLDLSMYVASGVVVYDLVRRTVKWSVHLDLTTDHVSLRCVLSYPFCSARPLL